MISIFAFRALEPRGLSYIQKYIMMMSMSQEKLQGIFEYDDNDERNGEMRAMRSRVDEANTGTAKGVPELQTDEVGQPEPMGRGYVYFFETEDAKYVKIGFSVNVNNRMGQMKTLVPMRLLGYFPGSVGTEEWLHEKFAKDRHTGEWFKSSLELRQFIAVLPLITSIEKAESQLQARIVTEVESGGNAAAMEMVRQRLKKLSPERRKEIAQKAAAARWGKKAK